MQLGREQRRVIYRERCRQTAAMMNAQAIHDNKLTLLISSNGHLSKRQRPLLNSSYDFCETACNLLEIV